MGIFQNQVALAVGATNTTEHSINRISQRLSSLIEHIPSPDLMHLNACSKKVLHRLYLSGRIHIIDFVKSTYMYIQGNRGSIHDCLWIDH